MHLNTHKEKFTAIYVWQIIKPMKKIQEKYNIPSIFLQYGGLLTRYIQGIFVIQQIGSALWRENKWE